MSTTNITIISGFGIIGSPIPMGNTLGVGVGVPADASTGIVASNVTTLPGCTQGFNFYQTASGQSYLSADWAARWCFTAGHLAFETTGVAGTAGQPIAAWNPVFDWEPNDDLFTTGNIFAKSLAVSGPVEASVSSPPADVASGVLATTVTTPNGPNQGFNFYVNPTGETYLATDAAMRWVFGPAGLDLQMAPSGTAGTAITTWTSVFAIGPTGATFDLGTLVVNGGVIVLPPRTVASLPLATTTAGGRAVVTDATTNTFASVVAGGGSTVVPVYSDGTAWRIG